MLIHMITGVHLTPVGLPHHCRTDFEPLPVFMCFFFSGDGSVKEDNPLFEIEEQELQMDLFELSDDETDGKNLTMKNPIM